MRLRIVFGSTEPRRMEPIVTPDTILPCALCAALCSRLALPVDWQQEYTHTANFNEREEPANVHWHDGLKQCTAPRCIDTPAHLEDVASVHRCRGAPSCHDNGHHGRRRQRRCRKFRRHASQKPSQRTIPPCSRIPSREHKRIHLHPQSPPACRTSAQADGDGVPARGTVAWAGRYAVSSAGVPPLAWI